MLAVKRYNIRRIAKYKIVESDQLRYNAQCIQFGPECNWSILISYRQKQENGRKGFEALAQLQVSGEFSQTLMKAIEFNSKHVNTMNVYQFDRSRTNFTVEELAAVLGSKQNY
ncbi:hypothetical protein Ahy_A09g044550 [Arachis hypogaea]|uniref:Transposase MuDR plant domain-containing protein n=1 Tax=Arachis hypogaea TaxID=3818 RepID=A0A445BKC1_ARAHY|nr:hypothetical protein Ahy_A09g044550 [Arachis hypogaea]